MATKYYTLKGSVKWCKVYEPDEFSGVKRWMLNFYPADGGEWEKFQKMGTELGTKEDTDGKYVTFRRPTTKLIGENLVVFSPPEISGAVEVKYVNDESLSVRSYNKGDKVTVKQVGEPQPIGNGSVVLVNLAVYDVKIAGTPSKGHRLENIKVLDLVSYDPDAPKESTPAKAPEKKEEKKEELSDPDLNDTNW